MIHYCSIFCIQVYISPFVQKTFFSTTDYSSYSSSYCFRKIHIFRNVIAVRLRQKTASVLCSQARRA